ncbi:MAG: hypothetical protein WD965_07105 [Actinomycetota bacterium]
MAGSNPRAAQEARSSSSRTDASVSRVARLGSAIWPASPLVVMTTAISRSEPGYFATLPAMPYVSSSGCAKIPAIFLSIRAFASRIL